VIDGQAEVFLSTFEKRVKSKKKSYVCTYTLLRNVVPSSIRFKVDYGVKYSPYWCIKHTPGEGLAGGYCRPRFTPAAALAGGAG
jgi:hypothetical protein